MNRWYQVCVVCHLTSCCSNKIGIYLSLPQTVILNLAHWVIVLGNPILDKSAGFIVKRCLLTSVWKQFHASPRLHRLPARHPTHGEAAAASPRARQLRGPPAVRPRARPPPGGLARLRQLDCGGGGQPRPPGRGDAPQSARQQPLPSHHLLHWDNLEPVEIRRR